MPISQSSEVNQIKSDLEKVIVHSQQLKNNPKFHIDNLIDQWLKNKKKFIERFKNSKGTTENNDYSNFIYEFPEPMLFPLDEETKISKTNGFIDYLIDYLYEQDVSEEVSESFIAFLKLNKESFFDNKVVHPFVYEGNKIGTDMKLLKSFKFFFSGRLLEDIQNKASILLQENKITGRFCISVHPLDYLSASETNYDWRSCHSLDGDYRSGNLAYMVDDCTVVCYLRGENKEKLPRFPFDVPWPSKKWRMLLFLNQEEEIVWAGRQYPFESKTIMEEIRKTVVPIITGIPFLSGEGWWRSTNWSAWNNEHICEGMVNMHLNDEYINIGGSLFARKSLVSSSNELFYNDLLFSTKYVPSYMMKTSTRIQLRDDINHRSDLKLLHLQVGKDPYCPCCGNNFVEYSDELICPSCDQWYGTQRNDEFVECDSCGARIWIGDAHEEDGVYYCDRCWEAW